MCVYAQSVDRERPKMANGDGKHQNKIWMHATFNDKQVVYVHKSVFRTCSRLFFIIINWVSATGSTIHHAKSRAISEINYIIAIITIDNAMEREWSE